MCALLIKLCARQYFYFRGTPHLKSQKKDGLKFKKDTKVSGSVGSITKKIRQRVVKGTPDLGLLPNPPQDEPGGSVKQPKK